ncbi:MAG: LysR family transcriptional regulator [Pseudomonadota bacterium]
MNWDDMRIFLSVARMESLSAAARSLRLDPATLGRRIQRLEGAMDMPLFAKSPQGYALTGAGERLLLHAERAEAAMQGAEEDLRGDTETLSGTIRIGAPDGCANYLLPQVTAKIVAENPDLVVQIVAQPRVFNLSRREADMAIGVSRPTAGRLLVQKISDYRLHLAASGDYLAAHGPLETRADLKGHSVVGYIPDMIFDKELDYLAQAGASESKLGANLASVQLNWLRHGAGVGIVHDFALAAAPELRRIMVDEISLTRTFWLVRHQDDRQVDRLSKFADLLCDGLRREIALREALA